MEPNLSAAKIDFTKGERELRDRKVAALAFSVGTKGHSVIRQPAVVNLPDIELHGRVSFIRVVMVGGAI